MTIRKLIVEMYEANRGRAASTAQIMRLLMLHGYSMNSVYPELQSMIKAGQLRASGDRRSRMLHSTPTTPLAAERKPGRPSAKVGGKKKAPKTPKVREYGGPVTLPDDDDRPFVHRLVSSQDWRLHASVAQAPRWVFDLGGRA